MVRNFQNADTGLKHKFIVPQFFIVQSFCSLLVFKKKFLVSMFCVFYVFMYLL